MNKYKLRQFERNNYYYGKLLTAKDFEMEQSYFNHKRYMVNRLLHGTGVVSGLNVIAVDDQTISLEPGVALDGSGREIVVAKPAAYKLSMIEGFEDKQFRNAAYLCITYDENGNERMESIGKTDSEGSGIQYNRMVEGYKLYFLNEDDVYNMPITDRILENKKVLYFDSQYTIYINVPTYVKAKSEYLIELIIDRKDEHAMAQLDFELTLSDGEWVEGNGKVHYDPMLHKSKGVQKIHKKATVSTEGKVLIQIKDSVIQMKTNEHETSQNVELSLETKIVDMEIDAYVKQLYMKTPFNERLENDGLNHLFLAKIDFVQVGITYVIKGVTHLPMDQVIQSSYINRELIGKDENQLVSGMKLKSTCEEIDFNRAPEVELSSQDSSKDLTFNFKIPKAKVVYENITTGTIELNIDESFKFSKSFLSDEIDHRLGLGSVFIQIGIEETNEGITDESMIFYGDGAIFLKDLEPSCGDFQTGAIAFPKKGTFKAGVRLSSGKKESTVTLRWWAYRQLIDVNRSNMKKFFVQPDEIKLAPDETYTFTALFTNPEDGLNEEVEWTIIEKNNGEISDEGIYTAPSVPTIATIKATLKSNPSVCSYGYITVEEEKAKNLLKKAKILKK